MNYSLKIQEKLSHNGALYARIFTSYKSRDSNIRMNIVNSGITCLTEYRTDIGTYDTNKSFCGQKAAESSCQF